MRRHAYGGMVVAAALLSAGCGGDTPSPATASDEATGADVPPSRRAATVSAPRVRSREIAAEGVDVAAAEDLRTRIEVAQKLRERVEAAIAGDRWNEALRLLNELDAAYKDDSVRTAVRFDELEAKVVAGRDAWFFAKLPPAVFAAMDELIAAKVREQRTPEGPETARVGTLAAARAWANREFDAQMWEKAGSDLGLSREELEKYWSDKRVAQSRVATYAKGSFIFVKPRPGSETPEPSSQEDWWSAADPDERAGFLTAYFVETSQRFVILRTDETNCATCEGRGFFQGVAANGGANRFVCASCRGCGVVRSVTYR